MESEERGGRRRATIETPGLREYIAERGGCLTISRQAIMLG